MRLRAGIALGAVAVATVVATAPDPMPVAHAAVEENRVAVIVDTGEEVKKVCVRFSEETISGAEALRRADVDPVFASYSGQGQAVCALCGVGCPASDCFCDARRFWAYHRASYPETSYTFSRAGASNTRLYDGDVEGWKWGSGEAPPFASVVEVCGGPEPEARESTATTTSSTARAATTTTTAASPAEAESSSPSGAGTEESASHSGVGDPHAGATTTSISGDGRGDEATGEDGDDPDERDGGTRSDSEEFDEELAAQPADDSDGSAAGLIVAGLSLAAIVAWWARLRRRRAPGEG